MQEYDVIVIGGGSAGFAAARSAAQQGVRVGLVESGPVGGHCLLKSRLPRNILDDWTGRPDPQIAFQNLIQHIQADEELISETLIEDSKGEGVEWIPGVGSLAGARQISVQQENESLFLKTNAVVIATGSLLRPASAIPFDDQSILPVDSLWDWPAIPESLLVVHGDPVGLEAAYTFSRLGVKVFLVEPGERLIYDQDPDLIAALEAGFKKRKIKTLTGKKIVSLYKDTGKIDVTLDGGVKFSVEKILVSGERLGNTESLGLKPLGVETGKNKEVWVNEYMETSLKGIYAAGSVTGHSRLKEKSEEEGKIAGMNAAGKRQIADSNLMPWVVHTDPSVASIGCLSGNAHFHGYRAVEGRFDFSGDDVSNSLGGGFCKIIADRESQRLIGAQIFGAHASDIITWLQSCLREGMTVKKMTQISQTYPQLNPHLEPIISAAKECVRALSARR